MIQITIGRFLRENEAPDYCLYISLVNDSKARLGSHLLTLEKGYVEIAQREVSKILQFVKQNKWKVEYKRNYQHSYFEVLLKQ